MQLFFGFRVSTSQQRANLKLFMVLDIPKYDAHEILLENISDVLDN